MSETGEGARETTPRQGYKKVQMGPKAIEIPEEWEHCSFSDAIELNPRCDLPEEGPVSYLPMDAVSQEQQTIEYWTERNPEDCTTTKFENGDTVYAKITPCAENGKIAQIEGMETSVGSGSTEFLVFRAREGRTDPEFVFCLVNFPQFRSVTISLMEGSTARQRIPTDVFRENLPIPLPPLLEQHRIAEVLSTVDKQIQQTEAVIKTTEELKQGLMQDLYKSGYEAHSETRDEPFGTIPADWELGRIESHAGVISGTHVKSDLVTKDSTQTPYLTGPADFERTEFAVTKYTNSPKKFCEPGDVLVTVKGMGCGQSALANQRVAISRQLKSIRPDDSLDQQFLFYWLRRREQILSILAEGTRQPGLSVSDIETFPLPIPPLKEQEKVGETLATVERKVVEEIERYNELQDLKRGLMQDLLTGAVRVPESIEAED